MIVEYSVLFDLPYEQMKPQSRNSEKNNIPLVGVMVGSENVEVTNARDLRLI